jgi:hypothetical protein
MSALASFLWSFDFVEFASSFCTCFIFFIAIQSLFTIFGQHIDDRGYILIFINMSPWLDFKGLASSTTKTGRHDIAEILLKVALKHQK